MAMPDDAKCLACGYLLRGLMGHSCPECGRAFNPDDPASYLVPARRPSSEPWSPLLWTGIVAGELGLIAWGLFSVVGGDTDDCVFVFLLGAPFLFFLGAMNGMAAFLMWRRVRAKNTNPAGLSPLPLLPLSAIGIQAGLAAVTWVWPLLLIGMITALPWAMIIGGQHLYQRWQNKRVQQGSNGPSNV
jgi:hypothetical protein